MSTTTAAQLGEFRPSGNTVDKREQNGFRTDVQALRAVAVLAVVVNHLWPESLTGGYVGVDVFFVISGFLITSHLDREIMKTQRLRLLRFYARRVRRLLPAAFLVIGLSVVAAYFLLPYPWWSSTTQEAVASATYWENWLLAANSVEYSNLTRAASMFQHYWSLSVEEQFYLFWPLLLLLLYKVRVRRAKVIGIAVAGAASFAFCVVFTDLSKSQAYFATPVRVWEFAIGALIALAGARIVLPAILANLASFAGVVMIVGSAFGYDHHTNFPGWAALVPSAGTGLIILAGTHTARQWHTPVSALRPVQFAGNISYSLYLWHWPLIVLAPFALRGALADGRLTPQLKAGVLVISVALAWVTKLLVEDRFRTWAPIARSSRLTFTGMIAGMAAVAVAAGVLNWTYDRHVAQAALEMGTGGPCHGAAARVKGANCPDPFGPAKNVNMGPANEYWNPPEECGDPVAEFDFDGQPSTRYCDFSLNAPGHKVVWLVGDSHAQQWLGPIVDLAKERQWELKISFQGGCPFARIQYRGYQDTWPESLTQRCMAWTPRIADLIASSKPDIVFTSFFARQEYADDHSGRSQTEQYREGVQRYWHKWTDAGARVIWLVDPPLNKDVRAVDCVTLNPRTPLKCAVERTQAQPPDPLTDIVKSYNDPNVAFVDLTDYFCDERKCYAVVGNVAVYFDANHMNLDFSRTLRPMIASVVDS
ncbi:acyltransferase family protein [Actinocrispum sp. NPDC049592]|uniref:acyltransferase family protein n=1 Tax=Actinocrispum sp. NPDC049592 TaxID=3154835 RepID=UPI00344124C0